MTKKEMMNTLETLLKENNMNTLDGINTGSTKAELEEAIECLQASDAELDKYMDTVKEEYGNTATVIENNGNWKLHSYNRLYIYRTAKMLAA